MRIEIQGLHKTFAGRTVLDIDSFACEFSHCLALIGPSGGGKSTLLRILGGLESADRGRILIDGVPLPADEKGLREHRRRVGTVFQAFNLFPHLTAMENIVLPMEKVHGISPEKARRVALAHLERFGLAEHAEKKPAQLSGGQRQRVAIVRALAIDPSFFLLDEPTSALDPEMTSEVLDLLGELRGEKRPLVLVTHEIGFARLAADVVAFLEDGHITASAAGLEFFKNPPAHSVRRFLEKTLRFSAVH